MLVSHLCPTNSLLAPRQQPAVRRLGPFKSSGARTSVPIGERGAARPFVTVFERPPARP
ncbi:hypothetical protein G6O69_09475 [Pseudenhygromyxa sp. WMMC2535]|uniref:hypothetical protein n=1 Tax=Pseudenhygromyxa sp. WMMC2535 TaxID=2712867 RepID=UPI001595B7B8|nr:hypothetical protein [Pseudenhygromyxa sp. WMMC2535]NVB38061.1 hypothetical protein [Pseudenhygromyxa sp. WMMC2535]